MSGGKRDESTREFQGMGAAMMLSMASGLR